MLRTRIIPALLLRNESLVKTKNFNKFSYIGDPCNTVRIFNELEVDELVFLDIMATRAGRGPNFDLLVDIANECFMPLGYGGGIRNFEDAKKILKMGFEKVILNSYAVENPEFITTVSKYFGNQAVVVSMDVKKDILGRKRVFTKSGRKNTGLDPVVWAREVEKRGAGEILLTSIDREGTWRGLDIDLIRTVTDAVNIPVIAHGGAGTIADIGNAVTKGKASAVALGNLIVFQKKDMGVLVNFPDKKALEKACDGQNY